MPKAQVKPPAKKTWRLLNRDGSFNISQLKKTTAIRSDLYHWFLVIRWRNLLGIIFLVYLTINVAFAFLYLACGPEALEGGRLSNGDFLQRFQEAFFFSVQTFATIGYGKVYPNSLFANLLVTIEALIGLSSFALSTGLVFSRFSRPTARVSFSNNAVILMHDKVPSLMFRLANLRSNQIVEAVVSVTFSRMEETAEGEKYRTFYDLLLERNRSPIFVLTWTVVHSIDKSSPLYGLTSKQLYEIEAEILVSLTGIEDAMSQTIHARFSYSPDEILWNHRFGDMLSRADDGSVAVDIDKLHEITPIESGAPIHL